MKNYTVTVSEGGKVIQTMEARIPAAATTLSLTLSDTSSGPLVGAFFEVPKSFYSNVNRGPVVGDVATTKWDAKAENPAGPWFYTAKGWFSRVGLKIGSNMPPTDNVLLVDGNTGKALS